ncbi:MAG: leucine-rich repeat protein [Firmicutes bacterium]|nr:leucine-rich repeat protein [Bacillota bacterium]
MNELTILTLSEHCRVDMSAGQVLTDGQTKSLTARQWKLLEFLVANAGQVRTYDQILDFVWGEDYYPNNREQGIRDLLTAMKKLHPDLVKYITNKRGVGYFYEGPTPVRSVPKPEKNEGIEEEEEEEIVPERPDTEPHFRPIRVMPVSGDKYQDRPEITEAIDEAFWNSRVVFLSAFGGMGKSELARNYARVSSYDLVIPMELVSGENETFDWLLNRVNLVIEGDYEVDKEMAVKRKLLNESTDKTLVIVDNYNFENPQLIMQLMMQTGNARILITSQLGNEALEDFGHVIPLPTKEEEFCCMVFAAYAEADIAKDPNVLEIVQMIGCHTMIAAILGTQIKVYGDSSQEVVEDMRKSLRESLQREEMVRIRKDHSLYLKGTPYEILKTIFANLIKREFTPMERQVLGAWFVGGGKWSTEEKLTEVVGDLPGRRSNCRRAKTAIMRLVNDNIMEKEGENLHIHPLMQQLLKDKELGDEGEAIAEMSDGFIDHLYRNEYASELLCPDGKPEKLRPWIWMLNETNPKTYKTPMLMVTVFADQGRSLYLFDCIEGIEECFINCSQQRLPEYRYYGEVSAKPQKGTFTTAKAIGNYDGSVAYPQVLKFPDKVAGAIMTGIDMGGGKRMFNVQEVLMPDTVEYIGDNCFEQAPSLRSVQFSKNLVEVGHRAFCSCPRLSSVALPRSVKSVGALAFSHCPRLLQAYAPAAVELRTIWSEYDDYSDEYMEELRKTDIRKYKALHSQVVVESNRGPLISLHLASTVRVGGDGLLESMPYGLRFREVPEGKAWRFHYPFDEDCVLNVDVEPAIDQMRAMFPEVGQVYDEILSAPDEEVEVECVEINGETHLVVGEIETNGKQYLMLAPDSNPMNIIIRRIEWDDDLLDWDDGFIEEDDDGEDHGGISKIFKDLEIEWEEVEEELPDPLELPEDFDEDDDDGSSFYLVEIEDPEEFEAVSQEMVRQLPDILRKLLGQ